jgi:hypothetical protein
LATEVVLFRLLGENDVSQSDYNPFWYYSALRTLHYQLLYEVVLFGRLGENEFFGEKAKTKQNPC